MKPFPFLLFAIIALTGCANKYSVYKSQYKHAKPNRIPDYSDLFYWASHPWKRDPADSIPKPLINEPRDSVVDVFFLHPTVYTSKRKFKEWNVEIDDEYNNAKTDYSTILYQASVFNQHARIFAPRYREAHIKTFFLKDSALIKRNLELAYTDIKNAFEYYLKNWNHNRPIIIAGHSQGSVLAQRLLKEFFENKPLNTQLVAAYITGWSVAKDYSSSLRMCSDSTETNCLCGWRTFRKGYIPKFLKYENGNSFVTNPLTWKTDDTYANRKANKGSVLFNFNKIYKHTTDGYIQKGVLWVKKPKFPWGFTYFTRTYHIADINLYYINVRENVEQRINAYLKNHAIK